MYIYLEVLLLVAISQPFCLCHPGAMRIRPILRRPKSWIIILHVDDDRYCHIGGDDVAFMMAWGWRSGRGTDVALMCMTWRE